MTTHAKLTFPMLQKIVWAFADMIRDKGRGEILDYAKIVLPTCILKRTLDIHEEMLDAKRAKMLENLNEGFLTTSQVISEAAKVTDLFNVDKVTAEGGQSGVLFITWKDLIAYEDNPNGEMRTVGQATFGQPYQTTAKTFVNLMFEIVEFLNTDIHYVFSTFEFENLMLQKKIVPYEDFAKTCREELNISFSLSAVSVDVFSDVYMDLVGRFAEDSGKRGGEFFTPHLLVENALKFLDLDAMADEVVSGKRTSLSVGDPTSGSNTFLTVFYDLLKAKVLKRQPKMESTFQKMVTFFGQELKNFNYCLGIMNMLAHGVSRMFNPNIARIHQNSNTISNYANGIGSRRGTLDVVLANPPYGLKNYGIEYAQANKNNDDRWKWGIPNAGEGEMAFLMTVYDLLNKRGKAVVVMPLGTLFRDAGRVFRENLIKEDVVEGIVALPSNMFLTTQIPVCLWILNKDKADADKGKVFFVNATEDFKKVGKFNEWQPEHAQQNYLTRTEEAGFSGYVDFDALSKNAFNLSVERYFAKEEAKEVIDLVALTKDIRKLEASIAKDKAVIDDVFAQILKLEGLKVEDDDQLA